MDATEPDKWDRATIYQQWRGLNFRANRIDAEFESQHKLVADLRKEIESLKAGRVEDMAEIGELKGKLADLESKHATMATWIKERLGKNNGEKTKAG
jgi:uncharacterized coiled-coil DUF342 family protein